MTLPPPPKTLRLAAPAALARRGWLKLLATATALGALGTAAWQWRQSGRSVPSGDVALPAMVERLVDLLVPRDDTPGAVDLGVHRLVLQALQNRPELQGPIADLVAELERDAASRYRRPFLALDGALQTQLLQALSQAPLLRAGGPGFLMLRQETLNLYYAQPQAWPALAFHGPPQPGGFVDYTQPPRPRV